VALDHKAPLRDSGGAMVDISRDITEYKPAVEALQQARDQLQAVLDAIPGTVSWIGSDLRYLGCNRHLAEALNLSPEALVGQEVGFLGTSPELAAFAQDFFASPACEASREVVSKETEGALRHYLIVARKYQQDQVAVFVGIDITEGKRAEEALRHSLEETARGRRLLLALSQAAQAVQRAHTPDQVYRTIGEQVAGLGYHTVVLTLQAGGPGGRANAPSGHAPLDVARDRQDRPGGEARTDERTQLVLAYLSFESALVQAAEKLMGVSVQDVRVPLAPGSLVERIIAEGEAAFSDRTAEEVAKILPKPLRPLAFRLAALLGLEQSVLAPLTVGGKPFGLLAISGVGLTETAVPAVSAFANQAAIAIENARLYGEARAGQEQLRSLASYLQIAREEERSHIAREIHDELGQLLTASKMDLSWLAQRLPADQPHLAEKAGIISDLIDSIIQRVRRVATELRPGMLDDLGLAAAIEWQTQEFTKRTGIACDLYLSEGEIALDSDLATAIFRILQEVLTNVARHAGATEVRVELADRSDELVLIVWDNGRGITESQVSDPRSLGLLGMRERARAWGGDITVQGVRGRGTTVTLRVPRRTQGEAGDDQGAGGR